MIMSHMRGQYIKDPQKNLVKNFTEDHLKDLDQGPSTWQMQ